MLTIKNLTVKYGENTVLENLSLDLEENVIHGLVGVNGSGKTTLLNTMYGIIEPEDGEIMRNGEELLYSDISYLESVNYFYPRITGSEYLGLFKIKNPSFDIQKWNQIFQLPLDTYINTYSTGMKKKLAFMGILCLDREILILDEPFNSLDLETNSILFKILELIAGSGKTMIITSHILETLTSTCRYIHYLNEGIIEKSFSREEFPMVHDYIFSAKNAEKLRLADSLLSGKPENN